ncbi:MAG: hypothetical protein U0270_21820 [Labilithrix sp.]
MKRFVRLIAAAMLVSSVASADDITEGRARFNKGVTLFREKAFSAALVEFNAAYAAAPSFRIQYNIAQTCNEMHDYACAYRAFERFLADGGKDVPKDQQKVADAELKRLKPLVSSVYVVVNLSGADVAVDDAKVGTSPLASPVLASAGRHTITALKTGLPQARTVLDVPGGVDRIDVRLEISEPKAPPLPPPPPGEAPPEKSRLPMWIGIGATGALAVTTATLGILTLGAKSDLHASADRFGSSPRDIESAQSKQDTLAVVTDVVLGATIVAAGITTAIVLLRR